MYAIDLCLHRTHCFFSALRNSHDPGDGDDIGVNIGEGFRSQAEKPCPGLQNFRNRLLLVGHGGDYQIRLSCDDLTGIGSPRIVDDGPAGSDLGADIDAIAGARNHAIQLTDCLQDDGRTRLQADHAAG